MLYETKKAVSAGLSNNSGLDMNKNSNAETQRRRDSGKTTLNSASLFVAPASRGACLYRLRLAGFLSLFFIIASIAIAAGPPTIVFMTDFGTIDDSVALCKGVM